jgi:peroxiredoxin
LFAVLAVGQTVGGACQFADAPDDRTFDNGVELRDFRGKEIRLSDYSDSPFVAIAFLGTGCPLAKLYSTRLQELADNYSDQRIAFIAVDPLTQDSLEEMAAFAREHKLEIPFAKDVGQQLARNLGATRTPEVFLIDQKRTIRYRGRIDDQYGVGYTKKKFENSELVAAIDAVLAGHPVEIERTDATGCLIGFAKQPNEQATVTYSNQVVRILNEHCVKCHRAGQIGPFAMDSYEEVAGWAEMIGEVVKENRMPPWHADPKFGKWSNDCSLAEADKKTIFDWIVAGAPLGEPAQIPSPPIFVSGWQLPREPDLIVPVTTEPHAVPATGDVKYQYFKFDPKFTEDKWIVAAELRPSNLRVVHHILCFVRPKGTRDLGDGEGLDGFLVGYVPGMLSQPMPPGMAKKVPKGSEFVFQIHYTPIGTSQSDHSQMGLVFADTEQVSHEVVTVSAVNPRIEIPAGESDHTEQAWNRRPIGDWQIINFMPHMHLRGKAFRYEAVYPDGKRETLLDVPRFDFNWQTSYWSVQPLSVPQGSRIYCTAKYDNSSANLNNPNPKANVRWGDQTWEEMMIGYFDVAIPIEEVESNRDRWGASLPKNMTPAQYAVQLMARWDKNKDQKLQRTEVPSRWQRVFDQIASEGSDEITSEQFETWLSKQQSNR